LSVGAVADFSGSGTRQVVEPFDDPVSSEYSAPAMSSRSLAINSFRIRDPCRKQFAEARMFGLQFHHALF
jgi:hypothetical protein